MNNILGDNISSIELIDHMGNDLRIVHAARVSFNRETKGETQDKKLISYLIKNRHWGPFEHVKFTFKVTAPLFVVRQWFRHRTWQVNEISRRYTSEDIKFYVPTQWRMQDIINKQSSELPKKSKIFHDMLNAHSNASLKLYNAMLDSGVAREMARMFLPQNMYTSFYGTVDLRNLLGFLKQRLDTHAQLEIREYAKSIITLIKPIVPWTIKEDKFT